MDVIGFVHVSLGSSTVQVVDPHVNVQKLVSVVKMAVVLGCATEDERSAVLFVWAKRFNAKDIHKEMFPVYGGNCLSLEAVYRWVEKLSPWWQTFC
jgi:hypothetical protein